MDPNIQLQTALSNEVIYFKGSASLKGDKDPGVFYITSARVVWTKDDKKANISLPISQIKSQLIGGNATLKLVKDEKQGWIFDFIGSSSDQILKSRDAAVNYIRKLIQSKPKPKTSTPSAPSTPKPPSADAKPRIVSPSTESKSPLSSVSKGEASERQSLLNLNKELSNLYKQLVPGVITDEEFWESRKSMLENEKNKKDNQDVGPSTALLADVRPTAEGNEYTYKITAATVHQILSEHPGVKKLYDEIVPHKMSEVDFWTNYFKSLYFHREKSKISTISTQTEVDEKFLKVTEEEDQKLQEPVLIKRKLPVDRGVDVSANDAISEYGFYDEFNSPSKLIKLLPTIRRFNRHGAIVVHSPKADYTVGKVDTKIKQEPLEPPKLLHEAQPLVDLENEAPAESVPLNIEDQHLYFEARANTAEEEQRSDLASLKLFSKMLQEWKPNPTRTSITDPSLATKVLQEISDQKRLTKDSTESSSFSLPEEFQRELLQYFTTANELLRHFWSSFPITSKELTQKVKRISSTIVVLYDKINAFRNSLPPERKSLGNVVSPILDSLDKAIEKAQSMQILK